MQNEEEQKKIQCTDNGAIIVGDDRGGNHSDSGQTEKSIDLAATDGTIM